MRQARVSALISQGQETQWGPLGAREERDPDSRQLTSACAQGSLSDGHLVCAACFCSVFCFSMSS